MRTSTSDPSFRPLLLIIRLANGNLEGLLARQRRVYLQRLKDLGDLQRRARHEGRDDLVLLIRAAIPGSANSRSCNR